MSDLINRQQAIDAIKAYWKKVVDDIPKGAGFEEVTRLCDLALEHNTGILKAVDNLPSAETHDKRAETRACDCINRREAIDFIDAGHLCSPNEPRWSDNEIVNFLKSRPSAQPDIIRCKDCKYSDENWRRISVKWLPCMDIRVPSNWFCGSAERKEE